MFSCFRLRDCRRTFRQMLGWAAEPLNPPTENTVLVFPHTSYWDAFLFLLYKEDGFYALTKPQLFTWWTTPILDSLGFVPAPKLEERGSGGVVRISERLLDKAKKGTVCFCISPKGTIKRAEWRSGYRRIAEQLGWPIHAVLFDYETRTVEYVAIPPKSTDFQIQAILSRACPKNPQNAELPVARDYDAFEIIAPFDLPVVTNFTALAPLVKMIWYQHYAMALIATFSIVTSCLYHLSREKSFRDLDRNAVIILISAASAFYGFSSVNVLYGLFAVIFYWCGAGRDCSTPRGAYVIYHSLFHVFLSATALSAIH